MRMALSAAVGSVLLLGAAAHVAAHHSFQSEFDINRPIQLTGTVTTVEWINPHAWIHVDVKRPDGTIENWAIETGSRALIGVEQPTEPQAALHVAAGRELSSSSTSTRTDNGIAWHDRVAVLATC